MMMLVVVVVVVVGQSWQSAGIY